MGLSTEFKFGHLLEGGRTRPSLLPVLRVTAAVGTFWVAAIFATTPEVFHNVMGALALGLLGLLWVALSVRLPDLVHFAIVETVYFGISADSVAMYGEAPAIPVLLALFILLATIYFGKKGGFIAGVASLALITVGAWGWITGRLPIGAHLPPLSPLHYDFWIRSEFAQILAVCGIVGIVSYIIGEIRGILLRLRLAEEKFSKAFRVSPDAMVMTELESGRIVEVNESHEKLTGYRREEVLGRTHSELGIFQDAKDHKDFAEKLAATGSVARAERRVRDRAGRSIDINYSAESFEFAGLKCTLAILQDITEIKRTEVALRESEERFRNLTAAAFEGVVITENGRVVDISDQALRMVGYERDELIGREVFHLISPETRELVRDNIANQRELAYQHRLVRKDGTTFDAEAQAKMMRLGDRVLRVTALRDISERLQNEQKQRNLEEQLRHTQKMEALGTMAGGIAHDFNNILTGIMGNLQLAELDLPGGHPALDTVQSSVQACRRARDLVARILAFSRLAQDNRSPAALGPIVQEAVDLLRVGLPGGIEIRADIDPACPPVVLDSGQMHQVVMNLGTNAIHALKGRKGFLSMELHTVEPGSELQERHPQVGADHVVRLIVRDNGCGMEAAVLKHIFEPFYTTRKNGQGTGLGLAMVHAIVKSHGGAIVVESKPGSGTRFELYLPAAGKPTGQPSSGRQAAGDDNLAPFGVGRRIMIVDDQNSVLSVGSRLLTRMGFLPMPYERPADALEAFRTDPTAIAAVISDLTMPGMTGLELASRILGIRPETPVIIASGYLPSETQQKARSMGVRSVISKPFELQEMIAHIRANVT